MRTKLSQCYGNREDCCSFSGHRPDGLPGGGRPGHPQAEELRERLGRAVDYVYNKGVRTFFTGGALGFDTWAALAVLELKKRDPSVRLVVIAPHANQDRSWTRADRQTYRDICDRADAVEVLYPFYVQGCMQVRNRALAIHARYMIIYCVKASGGTAYTLDRARENHCTVYSLAENPAVVLR